MKDITITTHTTDTAISFDDKVRKGIFDSFKGIIDIYFDDQAVEKCFLSNRLSREKEPVDMVKVDKAIQFISDRNNAKMQDKHIEFLLGKLRLVSKKKENDSRAEATLIKAYCEYLRDYPSDILAEVLQDFPRIWANRIRASGFIDYDDIGWYPTVAEIMAVVEDRLEFRRSFLSCLNALKNRDNLALTDQTTKQKEFTRFDEIFNEKMAEFMANGDTFMQAGKKANDFVNALKGV